MEGAELGWVDLVVFLTERRDLLTTYLEKEQNSDEIQRLKGAIAEIDWIVEQLNEQRFRWVLDHKSEE